MINKTNLATRHGRQYALVNLNVPPYFLAPQEGDLVEARPVTSGKVPIH